MSANAAQTEQCRAVIIDMAKPDAGAKVRSIMAGLAAPRNAAERFVRDIRDRRQAEMKACATGAERHALQARFALEDDASKVRQMGEAFVRQLGAQNPTVWTKARVEAAIEAARPALKIAAE